MDLHVSLDAREVLFHLNYMGFNHITREQLKSFMTDLKKLIKYESNPQQSTTADMQRNHAQLPLAHNIERLLCHTETSKLKQREKHPVSQTSKDRIKESDKDNNNKMTRNKSAGDKMPQPKEHASKQRPHETHNQPSKKRMPVQRSVTENKENIQPSVKTTSGGGSGSQQEEVKSKMWIRPKSAQTSRPQLSVKKRNDPVALYQEYQRDWERFRPNICESSRSELRWKIREKMLSNH